MLYTSIYADVSRECFIVKYGVHMCGKWVMWRLNWLVLVSSDKLSIAQRKPLTLLCKSAALPILNPLMLQTPV